MWGASFWVSGGTGAIKSFRGIFACGSLSCEERGKVLEDLFREPRPCGGARRKPSTRMNGHATRVRFHGAAPRLEKAERHAFGEDETRCERVIRRGRDPERGGFGSFAINFWGAWVEAAPIAAAAPHRCLVRLGGSSGHRRRATGGVLRYGAGPLPSFRGGSDPEPAPAGIYGAAPHGPTSPQARARIDTRSRAYGRA